MKCHNIDYVIYGDDMQVVEIELDSGETVIAKAGAMNGMDNNITFEAKMGDGLSLEALEKCLMTNKLVFFKNSDGVKTPSEQNLAL